VNQAMLDTVSALLVAVHAKDYVTATHSMTVAELSARLAVQMGMDDDFVLRVTVGALLHDVGKIGIPDAVLQKRSALSDGEYACMQAHPMIGVSILGRISALKPYLPVVESHHEWWNGKGYPNGLRSDTIPYEAQVVAFCDVFDAMSTSRPYRSAMARHTVLHVMEEQVGVQFAPDIWPFFRNMMTTREVVEYDNQEGAYQ